MKYFTKLMCVMALSIFTVSNLQAQSNHYLAVDNVTAGSNLWDRQAIYVLPTPMVKGKTYVVTISAKMEAVQDEAFTLWPVWNASENKNEWGGSNDVQYLAAYTSATEWTDYTWEFEASFDHDWLQFVFGKLPGIVALDNVSCKEKGSDTEMVAGGDFEGEGTTGWSVLEWAGMKMSVEEEAATAIHSVKTANRSNEVFDLQGRRVANPAKGLYIINGKKVVIK